MFSGLYAKIGAAGAVALAVLFVLWWAYSAGQNSADLEREKAVNNAHKNRETVEDCMGRLTVDELRRQLDGVSICKDGR